MNHKILNFRLLAFFLILVQVVVYSCQDDPYLVQPDDGNTVITPKSRVFIRYIQLNSHPAVTPSGDLWDVADTLTGDTLGYPDIFFNITDLEAQPAVLWSQPSHFANVSPSDTLPYYLQSEYEVVPFGSDINVNVYDFELPDSTLMGTLTFYIGAYPDPLQPYPDYITQVQNGFSLTLGIRWEE
jgi:hypothetical protein